MGKFRDLLNVLTEEVLKYKVEEWNVKEGMFSTPMCSLVSRDP